MAIKQEQVCDLTRIKQVMKQSHSRTAHGVPGQAAVVFQKAVPATNRQLRPRPPAKPAGCRRRPVDDGTSASGHTHHCNAFVVGDEVVWWRQVSACLTQVSLHDSDLVPIL